MNDLIPEEYRKGEVFNKTCEGKFMVYPNMNSFIQHFKTSKDWYHGMLLKYISCIHDKPEILVSKKKRNKKKW